MKQISGEAKRILLLKYKQGWSGKAIEEALHLSEGAAKMRLARARLKLQQLLNKRCINSEK
jgi:DNA-directed RNA polymerase specialized sigma24 family protein